MPKSTTQKTSVYIKGARLFFILACVCSLGFISGLFVTPDSLAWYHTLPLSKLTPPDFLFGLAWSILYILMAISAFLAWDKASPRYFALQLICTALWPFVFFYMHSVIGGLAVILGMLFFLILTVKTFYPASKTAALLLVPQILWGIFALYLNTALLIG